MRRAVINQAVLHLQVQDYTPVTIESPKNALIPKPFRGEVVFDNVWFHHKPDDPVLQRRLVPNRPFRRNTANLSLLVGLGLLSCSVAAEEIGESSTNSNEK